MYECLLNGTKLQKWSNSIQTKGMFCGGRSIFNDQMGVAAPSWTLRHSCAKNPTLFLQNSIIIAASNSKFPNNNSAHSRLTSAALVFLTTTPLNYSFCVGLVWFRCVPTSLHFYSLAVQQEIHPLTLIGLFSSSILIQTVGGCRLLVPLVPYPIKIGFYRLMICVTPTFSI